MFDLIRFAKEHMPPGSSIINTSSVVAYQVPCLTPTFYDDPEFRRFVSIAHLHMLHMHMLAAALVD